MIAAAAGDAKLRAAQEMGADALIDYSREPVDAAVKRLTDGAGADVVLDPTGLADTLRTARAGLEREAARGWLSVRERSPPIQPTASR